MEPEVKDTKVEKAPEKKPEVFSEVSLFDAAMAGSDENGDCGCFSCDGNPCNK